MAASALLVALVTGTLLTTSAQASGSVTCTAGAGSLGMSWTGETHVFQYEAFVQNSAGDSSSQIVAWRSASGTASVTFSSLSVGSYTVWVVKQTNDGSWIKFGETTCSVAEAAPPPTTTAAAPTVTEATPPPTTAATTPTTTTTTPAEDSPGSLSCSTTASSITVTASLNEPEASTATAWETFVEHSTGYPRLGQLTSLLDIDIDGDGVIDRPAGGLSTTFSDLAQGSWNITGFVNVPDTSPRPELTSTSCTVAGGL